MPVLICIILALYFVLVYTVEEGALISKQPAYQYYMLNSNAKERFQNHRGWKLNFELE